MWVKPFIANAQPYLYFTETNRIVRAGAKSWRYFSGDSTWEEKRQTAVGLGLLAESPAELAIFPDDMIESALEDLQREGPAHLVLTITEACNFRCRYCAYSGAYTYSREHSGRAMSLATALAALRWFFRFPRDHYHIGFYGGEPLLRRALIERIVSAARADVPPGATLSFGMTTNGWLLDEAASRFLAENDFEVFVSIDGPEWIHDRYRVSARGAPTFARIWRNLHRLRSGHPDYYRARVGFSITLAPPVEIETIMGFVAAHPRIFEGKIPKLAGLNSAPSQVTRPLGIRPDQIHIELGPARESYLAQMVQEQAPDPVARACTEAAMANVHTRNGLATSRIATSGGQCLPGTRCHVTPDGRLHMCEHGDEHWPIGSVDAGLEPAVIRDQLRQFRALVEPRCRRCWAVRLCRKCIPRLAEGATLSQDRLAAFCIAKRAALERDLIDYCRARSINDHCFDSLAGGAEEQTG